MHVFPLAVSLSVNRFQSLKALIVLIDTGLHSCQLLCERLRFHGEARSKENYISATEHVDVLEAQFKSEERLGMMVELSNATAEELHGPGLMVAALAAIEKSDQSFRVLHDGTHGVRRNVNI